MYDCICMIRRKNQDYRKENIICQVLKGDWADCKGVERWTFWGRFNGCGSQLYRCYTPLCLSKHRTVNKNKLLCILKINK